MAAKWEYTVTAMEGTQLEVRPHLNEMAADGWELINGSITTAIYADYGSSVPLVHSGPTSRGVPATRRWPTT